VYVKSIVDSKPLTIFFTATITILIGVFFTYFDAQSAFGFEENILALQTGIISTNNQDYAISQEFEAKIFLNGKIMRLSGLTTTGEQFYLYQKSIGDDTIVRGKILINEDFIPIVQKSEIESKKSVPQDTKEIIVLIKQPQYGYYYDTYTLTAKAFEAELNPRANFDQTQGYAEGVKINVTLTNDRNEERLTSFAGETNQFGVFSGNYLWGYRDSSGEYKVTVMIDDGNSISYQYFPTFYRGETLKLFQNTTSGD